MLPQIQSLLNNIFFFTTGKIPNKIAYDFLLRRSLNLSSAMAMFNTCVIPTDATDTISFALLNQKKYYNRKDQPLFMKVGNWAMLRLHKS